MTDTSVVDTSALGFAAFDADNHYYEAIDAFTRYLDPAFRKRGVQWATIDGQQPASRRRQDLPLHPQPDVRPHRPARRARPVLPRQAALQRHPGCLRRPRAARRPARVPRPRRPPRPHGRPGPRRLLPVPDARRRHGGGARRTTSTPLYASFRAFNRWLEDDWGFAYQDRIFAAAMLSLADPAQAEAELARVLEAGARIVCLRAAPIRTASGGRSPGDPEFAPVLGMVDEAGITVGYHSGDSGYGRYADDWGARGEMEAFRFDPFRTLVTDRPPDARDDRRPRHPRRVRRPPQPAGRHHRERVGLGARAVPPVQEVLQAGARGVPRRSHRDVPAPRVGGAVLRGRHPRPRRHDRRRPRAVRLRLAARRGPGRAGRLRRRPRRLRRRRGPHRSCATTVVRSPRRQSREPAVRHRDHRHDDRLPRGRHEEAVRLHHRSRRRTRSRRKTSSSRPSTCSRTSPDKTIESAASTRSA